MSDDAELLRLYAEADAQEAFGELVRRHVNFVYAVALRQLGGNAVLAQDVTQLVFIELARKAARLVRHPALVGWLHTTTRYSVRFVRRGELRRRAHERDDRVAEGLAPAGPAADWSTLQPLLDDVLGGLRERDRTAILLRFFEGRRLADVGARLSLSEDAARSCVDRALERMRAGLARRGVTSTASGLALALANQVSVAAPTGLAASVTQAGLAGAVTGGTAGWGALFLMSKIKVGVVGVAVAAMGVSIVVDVRANRELRRELGAARASAEGAGAARREAEELRGALGRMGGRNPEVAELTRLRDRVAALQARPAGVSDEEMKPVAAAGRETAPAACLSFMAGLNAGDPEAVARLIAFQDDSPEARAAFMASLPVAVRARYGTPERVFAAGLFRLDAPSPDPATRAQVLGVQDNNPGTVRVRLWIQHASGRESEFQEKFTRTPGGWSLQFRPLTSERDAAEVRARFDPVTGEPKRKP